MSNKAKILQQISMILAASLVLGCAGYIVYKSQTVDAAEMRAETLNFAGDAVECLDGQVMVPLNIDEKTNTVLKNDCLSVEEYQQEKTRLRQQVLDQSKGYDFDINDKELLGGIMYNEIKVRGGITIENPAMEEIRAELLNLLN